MGTKFSTTPLAGYTNTKFPALSDETAKGHVTPTGMRAAINVEDGATADQTGAEIKTALENEADTNTVTDAEKSAIDNLPADTTTAIADEALARAQADSSLQDNIDTESSSRIAADSALQAAIDALLAPDMGGATLSNYKIKAVTLSGAAVSPALTDSGANFYISHSAAMVFTVPTNATVGFCGVIFWDGAGQPTIAAAGGVHNPDGHTKLRAQYSSAAFVVKSNAGSAPVISFVGDTAS